jgi:hypothetical protein
MKNTRPIIVAFLILSLVSISCMCGLTEQLTDLVDEFGDEAAEIAIDEIMEAPESASEEETEGPAPGQGDILENKEGGFSLVVPKDYTADSAFGLTTMQAPDFNEETGPLFLAVGGPNDSEMTLDDLYTVNIEDMEDITVSGKREINVGGKPAYEVDLSGAPDGVEVVGKYVVVAVNPMQYFVFSGFSVPDRWDSEIAPIYAATLKSIKFFKPEEVSFEMPTLAEEAPPQASSGEVTKQWAVYALASSEYGSEGYSALQATGPPNTPDCGDQDTAWASYEKDTVEWLEVYYTAAVYPTEIHIHQTHTPNQIVKVEVLDEDASYHTVYEGTPELTDCPHILTVTIEDADYMVQSVKITVDQSLLPWDEIDAVELVGTP